MLRNRLVIAIAFVASLVGCASGGTGIVNDRDASRATNVSTSIITADEIARHSFQNAWQAIVALRPNWERLNAYVNDRPFGRFDRLQEVPVSEVKEIRMLDRSQARVRFGTDAQAAILIIKK